MGPALPLLLISQLVPVGGPDAVQRPLPDVTAPPGNPWTEAKAQLGKTLFWDEQLSADSTVACGSCHLPEAGGSDPRAWLDPDSARHPGPDGILGTRDDRIGSIGIAGGPDGAVQVTDRRPRSMIAAAFGTAAFWDGRAEAQFTDPISGHILLETGAALESQSLGPLESEVEMDAPGRTLLDLVEELREKEPLGLSPQIPADLSNWIDGRGYPALFEEAFESPGMNPARIAMAIGSYQRTLIPTEAPILQPGAMLTELEREGRRVFEAKKCVECHDPTFGYFADNDYHYIGQSIIEQDLGRSEITGDPKDAGKFLTPSLLNVELRAPYFHDGSKEHLDEVLDFYTRGGDHGTEEQREIEAAQFTGAERRALKAFLGRPLTDPRVAAATGPFERPLLSTESASRTTAAVRGLSGPSEMALRETPSLIQAQEHHAFAAWLPAEVELLQHRPFVRVAPVDTNELMAMDFSVPPLIPVQPALIGATVPASFRPLFANQSMRASITVTITATLPTDDHDHEH